MHTAVIVIKEDKYTSIAEEFLKLKGFNSLAEKYNLTIQPMAEDMFTSLFEPEETENIDVDIEDDVFLKIAKIAHEENMTFNAMITKILKKQIEKMDFSSEKSK